MTRNSKFQLLAVAASLVITADANMQKRYGDGGVHRVDKRAPQVTRRAVLADKRDGSGVCGGAASQRPRGRQRAARWWDGILARPSTERGANCVPPSGSAYTYACPTGHFLCPASASYGCCPNGMGCAVNQCYATAPTTKTDIMVITTKASGGKTSIYTTTKTIVGTPDVPTALPTVVAGQDGDSQKVLKYFPSVVAKTSPTGAASEDGGGGISPAQLGGIVAGAVAFVIIVLVVGFLLFRRQRRKNKEARRRGAITGGGGRHAGGEKAKPFQSVDSDNDTMSVDPLMMLPSSASPSPPHMHRPSPGLDSRISGDTPDLYGATSPDETPSSFAGGFQPVGRGGGAGHPGSTRHPSWDSATNNDTITSGYFDAQYVQRKQRHQRLVSSETGGVARTVSRMTHDSRPGYYGHGRDVSDASDASSSIAFTETEGRPSIGGATPTLVAELEAQPYVAELPPNSPASVSMLSSSAGGPSPIDPSTAGAYMQYHNGEHHRQRQRSSSGGSTTSVGSVATTTPGPGGRPPLVHQRKRSDGRAGTGRLGVVDEEMIHGYHGPREFLEGQTAAESPLTEIDEKSTK
ncbi:hypothetical protein Purlil1_7117 [Purpureocillium lilacinum]|uniref:Uncharacterized protein n=1 Tax=Purpureocillium lilacinum TaxID=33203 RepID=A0ABR0BXI2_PURLI|nr:hypothetical protein Purlil1_7117 [Purpureocillium lilacinum]